MPLDFPKLGGGVLLSSHIGSHCSLVPRRGVPSPGSLVLGLVQELRKLVCCVREATCKLFIACLDYWVNIDPRLWSPRSYLLFLRAHLVCGGAPLLAWALPAKRWVTQRPSIPLRDTVPGPSVETGLCGGHIDVWEKAELQTQANFCSYEL